ncbi:hypothetical protein ACWOAY_08640 [Granulicatella adiacens]|uniref:hypothetical protein n=1 Tax=Granulicatella adiacens TaxID=46124 RepID=UPI0021D91EFE|nr:hypothetical protein [Granulicatella adiacens]UXY41079.1 hypothetical protein N8I82_07685 [Granulicatella adiacens]
MNTEQRATIKNMLAIPNLITAYTDKLNNVRKMFFLTHSLIGGMMIDDLNVYTRSIDPYSAAVIIETEERIIRTRIDRLSKRYKLFTNEFTTEELNTLRRAVNENEATLITQRAYQWIEEVDFYLTARYEETDTQQEIQQKGEQLREISFLDEEFENMMRGVAI